MVGFRLETGLFRADSVTEDVASRKKPLERHYNGDNSQNYNKLVEGFMSLGRRVIHPQETYRFSTTHTLSDYPLLIGEILRRDQQRAVQQAKRQTFLYGLGRALLVCEFTVRWVARAFITSGLSWMRETAPSQTPAS